MAGKTVQQGKKQTQPSKPPERAQEVSGPSRGAVLLHTATRWTFALIWISIFLSMVWGMERLLHRAQHRAELQRRIDVWRSWPTVEGKVLRAEAVLLDEGGYKPVVEYSFVVKKKRLRGNQIFPEWETSTNVASVRALVSQFPVGSYVTVHYSPSSSKTTYLLLNADEMRKSVEADGDTGWYVIGAAILWMAIVGFAQRRLA